ncbi:ParB/RepB/Spo0J family partition protein [Anaerobiospirillum sp. NML120449]|uniref:ParB/RepB/Spo0J family partition protein n=1 Tax=Anaerobiospirillum sp. NML120449 TaxID=2932817 RepID=UPI001FF36B03|nr:ParB/RepB/Spo0J family partition protein [Anaerobiospirillum sp. NML120449]MCK0525490.1 ParB/RepB/Spo0J family partition protein [Anaerobiospirillum sp. NML120449]
MAGLGRSLGTLISDSSEKKSRSGKSAAESYVNDLLSRSLAGRADADKGADQEQAKSGEQTKSQSRSQAKSKANTPAKATAKAPVKSAAKSSDKTAEKATASNSVKAGGKSAASAGAKSAGKAAAGAVDADAKPASRSSTKAAAVADAAAEAVAPAAVQAGTSKSGSKKKAAAGRTTAAGKTDAAGKASAAKGVAQEKTMAAQQVPAQTDVHQGADHETDAELPDSAESSAAVTAAVVSEKAHSEKTSAVSSLAREAVSAQELRDGSELSTIASSRAGFGSSAMAAVNAAGSEASDNHLVLNVKLELLKPSAYQPRHSFDDEAIIELATSIKEHGLLEPLIVQRTDSGFFEIICGERRYRAARMLGMDAIPCLVRDVVDEKAYAIALIENIQRENLNPVELAIAFDQMMQECGMTQEEVARSVCKSRSAVANYLRVLKLEDEAMAALRAGQIDLGHAKVLLSLSGTAQSEACQVVIERGLSVRATESFVKEFAKKIAARQAEEAKSSPSEGEALKDLNFQALEKTLNMRMRGPRAKFKTGRGGKGKLTLSYEDEHELFALLTMLGLQPHND